MALDARDCLKWFNDETTRYRNHEWQISAYSGTILLLVVSWIPDHAKRHLIYRYGPLPPTLLVAFFTLFCFFAEVHTHNRLKFYRSLRAKLLRTEPGLGLAVTPTTISRKWLQTTFGRYFNWDVFYIAGFLGFILVTGFLAACSVWDSRCGSETAMPTPTQISVTCPTATAPSNQMSAPAVAPKTEPNRSK